MEIDWSVLPLAEFRKAAEQEAMWDDLARRIAEHLHRLQAEGTSPMPSDWYARIVTQDANTNES